MTQPKISAFPPKTLAEDLRNQFISGAEDKRKNSKEQQSAATLPWEKPSVRHDLKISYTMQLPEPYVLKLKYISAKTNKSQQTLLREIVMPGLDKLISELLNNA